MKVKKVISVVALSSLCFSVLSSPPDHHHDGYHGGHHGHKDGHSHHETIIGKTFLIHYSDQDYKLTFVSDSTIKWMDAKAKATEGSTYTLARINRGIYLSSWEDKSGTSLSQVIDMHGKKIYTAKLNAGRKLVNSVATITEEVPVEAAVPTEQDKAKTPVNTITPNKK